MNLEELRKIAEAATPGPWEWEQPSEEEFPTCDESLITAWKEDDGHPVEVVTSWGFDACGTEAESQDREFIATFNPQKVLSMLKEIGHLREGVKRWEQEFQEHSEEHFGMQARLAAVEKLHREQPNTASALYPDPLCSCGEDWPCPTIEAVRGD